MKKFFVNIGIVTLFIITFFYTQKVSSVMNEYDEIMINIKNNYKKYNEKLKKDIVKGDTVIIGSCSKKVNIKKSYTNMRQYGKYDPKLYIFDKTCNKKIKDKFIIKGSQKNKVSLIVKTDTYIDSSKDITIYTNNKEVMQKIFLKHMVVSDNDKYLKKILGQKNYCILENKRKKCKDNYNVIPNIIIKDKNITSLIKKIDSGSIILTNKMNYKKIINYLNYKGYEIISLKKMVEG